MAAFQTSCGQESCLCSCLFWDLELAKAWLNTARQYFELVKRPCKDLVLRKLLQPWKLTTLQEHDACFQQWNVLQLWIGIITALVMFVMNFIWHMAEDNILAKPPMGTIIVNALVAILLSAFLAHLAWYGVVQKHGCCCFVLCCCLGQPNLLVTAILSVVFGILAVISVIDAFSLVQGALIVVVLIGAVFVVIHAVTFFYVGFEAFMIWRLCSSTGAASSGNSTAATTSKQTTTGEVVGAAQAVGEAVADIEAAETKTEA
jgi:hypothetical protein